VDSLRNNAAHHNRLQSNICATILSLVLSPVPALASLLFDAQKIIMAGEMDDQSCVQRPYVQSSSSSRQPIGLCIDRPYMREDVTTMHHARHR
jgi:hypothetical protein